MSAAAKPKQSDALVETFTALKKVYKPYAPKMNVTHDSDSEYYLESRAPMYKGISPELKKRMQGKQCFNFAKPDAELFDELSRLAAEGAKRFAGIKDFEAYVKKQSCDD
jgi:hypothetical protein